MSRFNLIVSILLVVILSSALSFGQCLNCFEGPTTVFSGQTAYYYWGGTPGGTWYVTNVSPPGVIGTLSQTSDILSIPIMGTGSFSITHDNANGAQVNVTAWAVPASPDDPYVQSSECGHVIVSMQTQNKPADVDWYWIDEQGNFVSISTSLNVYSNSTYYIQSRSHDHPEIIGGNSQAINVTMPSSPVDGVIKANGSSSLITVCAGEAVTISSAGGVGSPHYWASSNGMASWDIFTDQHAGENSFAFSTWVGGTYTFQVRNRTDLCGFCGDSGNLCGPGSTVNVVVIPQANAGELFVNNTNHNACVGTRIPVSLYNNVGTAYYNIYYKKDTDKDGDLDLVSVEDAANLGTSFEYTLNDDGEWTFEYWSQACNQSSAHLTTTISVWAQPSAPQFDGPDRIICAGESANIHATAGYPGIGVRWYDSPNATTPLNLYPYTADLSTGPLSQSKTYWAASYQPFSSTTGCEGIRYEHFVTVTPRPVDSDIAASATSVCVGESIRITASGGVGASHFYCSSNGGSTWDIFNDDHIGTLQFDHTPQVPGTYRYRVRNSTACGYCGDAGNNCNGEKFVVVTVHARPVAGDIVGQKNVMFGQSYNYSVPDASVDAATFNWVVTDGSLLSGQGTRNVKALFAHAGGKVSVTVANGQCASVEAPSLTVVEGGNYVAEETVLVSGIRDPTAMQALDENSKSKVTAYRDALGRPIQTINWRGTPGRNDITTVNVYDMFGREPVRYLPFTGNNDGYYKAAAIGTHETPYSNSPQHNYYDGRTPYVAIDDSPNVKTVFEPSPLNRVLKQGAAGTAWQPDAAGQDDHTVEKKYLLNTVNEVYQFVYDATTGIAPLIPDSGGYYAANELLANKTIDEHNNETIEYTDKVGHIVCKKVQYAAIEGVKKYACTYYVYDDFGNLVVVLPPEAVKRIVEDTEFPQR